MRNYDIAVMDIDEFCKPILGPARCYYIRHDVVNTISSTLPPSNIEIAWDLFVGFVGSLVLLTVFYVCVVCFNSSDVNEHTQQHNVRLKRVTVV